MKLAKMIAKVTGDNYPELMIKTFFINVPGMFSFVWAIVKFWMDEKTKNKIGLYGKDYKQHLLKDIDEDQLPELIGGTCTAAVLEGHP